MMTRDGHRLTVFESDGGWKYCIAILPEDDDPIFSDPYPAKEIAIEAGEDHINGNAPRHTSPWEQRRQSRKQKTRLTSADLFATEMAKLENAEIAVAKFLSGDSEDTAIENFKDTLLRRARASSRLFNQFIDSDVADEAMLDSLSAASERYYEMWQQIDATATKMAP